jgi:activating signal cointegrator complex subunit 3
MATMNKPAFNMIRTHSPNKPVLIFVSSRRQTRLTALDIMAHCATDEEPKQFLGMNEEEMDMICSRIKDQSLKHTLSYGIGLHHAGLPQTDRDTVEDLFCNNKIQVLISTSTLAWGVNFPAHLVIIKGTEFYDGATKRYVDFPITDVLQMMGRAGRPQFDSYGKVCIFVHEPKKNFYKRFLYEPFPVESQLPQVLHEHMMAEVVGGTISSRSDAVDYLTWTYFFRRLLVNPSFYHLEDASVEGINTYLSELVDGVLQDLADARCIAVDDSLGTVAPQTLGRVASYYYLKYTTVRLFSHSITEHNTVHQLLQVLCDASEYDELPVRHNEDTMNGELAEKLPLPVDSRLLDSPHIKAHLLLQAHFSRVGLPISDYITDTKSVLDQSIRILQAMVDVAGALGVCRVRT